MKKTESCIQWVCGRKLSPAWEGEVWRVKDHRKGIGRLPQWPVVQTAQVQFLVGELRPCMLRGAVKNKEGKETGKVVFRESKNSGGPGQDGEGRQQINLKMGKTQTKLLNFSLTFFI